MTPQLRLMARRRHAGGGRGGGVTSDPIIHAVRAFKCPTLTRRAVTQSSD